LQEETDPLATFAPDLFRGRTALVTGGGRGIGRAVALGFARLGARVAIASRSAEHLEPTAREIEALGAECLAHPMSIREPAEVDALKETVLDRFGSVDFLINNAGGQFPATPSRISDNGWRSVVDLNLNGTWNMCQRFGPEMARQSFGAIVNIVHIYSFERGAPGFAHSGAARAGVVNLSRTLAFHWARNGVSVNALAPGTIDTQGVREEEFKPVAVKNFEDMARSDIPMGRFGSADETAAVALFLCSPAGRYINGTSIVADGALSLANWTNPLPPDVP
jgi:NAD(P)-dependent dehydrogenase (short-subunit alcohol dehydrogenase family)